jgi:DNA-binding GntR family transcriptional regulator
MRSLYSVRVLVESASAAEAALNMDDTRLATLRSILSQARQAYADDDADLLSDLNRRFHLVGHSANGNEVLVRVITDLSMRCQRYRLLHSELKDRNALSLREHEQLLEAWEAHDSEAASQRVTENLKNSEAALLQSFNWVGAEHKERDEQDER